MTRDDIIRMAQQSWWEMPPSFDETDGFCRRLERFANLVVKHEREECAKVCDEIKKKNMNERIEDLALGAGLLNYVDNETPRRCFIHGHADLVEVQKFAQMIVKDCLNELCDQMDKHKINLSNLPGWYRALEDTEKQFNT